MNLRTTDATRAKLEESAVKNVRSLTQEIEYRVNSSFTEEAALGGPQSRMLAISLWAAFRNAGDERAISKGLHDCASDQWLTDEECFTAAMTGALKVLIKNHPDPKSEHFRMAVTDFFGNLDIRQKIAHGELKLEG